MPDEPIRIGTLQTKLTWFMTPIGLLIDEVNLSGDSLTVDTDSLKKSQGEIKFEAIIRAKSVEVFLAKKEPAGLQGIEVEIKSEGVFVKATKTVIVQIPVKAHAVLLLDSPMSISISLISAEAMGAGLKNLVASQLETMNPIVESKMFPVPVSFEKVAHEEGQIRVTGKASLS
jgi:hypothetical protein